MASNTCTVTAEPAEGGLLIRLAGSVAADNAPDVEEAITAIRAQWPGLAITLDADELEYVASAGLRVVMRLIKAVGELTLINANPEVYDVFEMTGFTELMDVRRAAREVSVEGCEVIGEGGFGKVYRTDPETIVKVYNPTVTREFVDGEREQARRTFVLGVPTAIPYDLVRVGDCWGLVFELLDAKTVAQVVNAEPARVDECARILGRLLKELHAIEVPAGRLRDRAEVLRGWYTDVMGPYLEPDEVRIICDYIDSVPHGTTFLHGDYHTKNIMLQNGEPILIDVGDAAMGHPVFDWAQMCLNYIMLPGAIRAGMRPESLLGYSVELAAPLWRGQLATYLGADDAGELDRFQAMLMPLANLLSTYAGAQIAGATPKVLASRVEKMMRPRNIPAILSAPPIEWPR